MKKYIHKLLASLMAVILLSFTGVGVLMPATVSAQTKDAICQGVGITGGNCDPGQADTGINNIVKTIVNILSVAVGIIAVIMIIIGGLKYITSGGDSGSTAGAKNTILYALVGLVIVALAQVIVRFVLNQVK